MFNKQQIFKTLVILIFFWLLNINSIVHACAITSIVTLPTKQIVHSSEPFNPAANLKTIRILEHKINLIELRLKQLSKNTYKTIIISTLLGFLSGLMLFIIQRCESGTRKEMNQERAIFEYLYKQLDAFLLNLNLLSGFESALENSDEHFFIEDFELFYIDDMSISTLKDKLYADKLFSINSAFMRLNKWLEVSGRYNHKLVTAAFFEKTIDTAEYDENARALIERVETGYNELLKNAFINLINLLAEAKMRKEKANNIINFLITKNQQINQDKLNSKINELKQKILENNSDNNLANELLSDSLMTSIL